jgi:hypothetical protein
VVILDPPTTLQLADGNSDLPLLRFLEGSSEPVALTAPGIAYAADVIATLEGPQRRQLENRLREMVEKAAPAYEGGLFAPVPLYHFLEFGRAEARVFSDLRVALDVMGDRMPGALSIQSYTIANVTDLPIVLLDTQSAREQLDALIQAGIHMQTIWIS